MIIKCLPTGMFGSNCYIIGDKGEGAVIDAGVDYDEVQEVIQDLGIKIKYIILTHAHIDHICGAESIKSKTAAKILLHQDDVQALSHPLINGSAIFGAVVSIEKPDMTLKDGDIIDIGDMKLEVIHTPGHTPGGICIKADNSVFTGDTLFRASIGRTDLGNGSRKDLDNSIKTRLMILDDETVVYPGHGKSTTIGFEKKHNPYINMR